MERLNIAGHNVWNQDRTYSRFLYGPGDMEGHRGFDGRCYLIDCARLFPPSPPDLQCDFFPFLCHVFMFRPLLMSSGSDETGHLYKLMRPELVRASPVPLVSDCFAQWNFDPPNVCLCCPVLCRLRWCVTQARAG
jgi:hypothetical protein